VKVQSQKFQCFGIGFNLTFELWHLTFMVSMVNTEELLKSLPHAFPYRMIDRVIDIEPGKKAHAIKNVSIDEPYIQGRFPNEPTMPWVLMVEALAQTGGLAFQSSFGKEEGMPILARIDEFRLKGKVKPGDQIFMEAEIVHVFSNLAKVRVLAKVGEEAVAEGMLILAKGQTD
jgi:3-hydroxyacyl-[acyl-carrier-protein] dehydratase